jgi:hypothetical protein
MELALLVVLCALVYDQWASHGLYFHAVEATLRAAARPFSG